MPLLVITLSVLVTAGRSLAGDVSDGKATAVPPTVQAPEESWIHGDIGVEFSNQYIDRGFIYESTLKLLGAAGFYSGDFAAPKMNGLLASTFRLFPRELRSCLRCIKANQTNRGINHESTSLWRPWIYFG